MGHKSGYSVDQLILSLGPHKAKIKVLAGQGSFLSILGRYTSKLIKVVGKMQCPWVRELRPSFFADCPPGASLSSLKSSAFLVILPPSILKAYKDVSRAFHTQICLPFLLSHLSDSNQRKCSVFKGSCDKMGYTGIIWSALPILSLPP